jgi:ribosome biogenesis GTPase A
MTINWFPGHMNKARRELSEALRQIDVVIELVDARLPRSSQNPMLETLRGDIPCLTLLNKADLADPVATASWLEVLDREPGRRAIEISADQAARVRGIPGRCRELAPQRRGPGKTVRCIVVGIPNVGKSTLINSLVGRRVAKVADRPAVTQRQQLVHLDKDIRLADTPGVLWPKLEDQQGAYRLAASGGIRETAFDVMDVAVFAARFLAERYPGALLERYKLEALADEPLDLLESVGRKRGFLRKGGVVDVERAGEVLLRELRSGELGRISFERPDDFDEPGA